MKLLSCAFVVAVLLLSIGCATPLVVDHDYDTTYDFTRLRTYDWAPSQPGSEKEELAAKRWEQAVNSRLQSRGYTRSAESPDFLVVIEGVRKTVQTGSTAVGARIGC